MRIDFAGKALLFLILVALISLLVSPYLGSRPASAQAGGYLMSAQGTGVWIMRTSNRTLCYYKVLGDGTIWVSRTRSISQDLK